MLKRIAHKQMLMMKDTLSLQESYCFSDPIRTAAAGIENSNEQSEPCYSCT